MTRESSSPWSVPLVFIKKNSGTKRPCIDYRQLNAMTVKDVFPLPRVNDRLDSLEEAKYFYCMDLTQGFFSRFQ